MAGFPLAHVGLGYDAAATWGSAAAATRAGGYGLWGAAAGLILAGVGAYKQYQMYSKMGDLATTQATAIADQQARSNRLTDEYFIPQLKKARDYLWGYANTWGRSVQELVVECATEICVYTSPVRSNASILAASSRIIEIAKRNSRRTHSLRQPGRYDQSVRYSMVQGSAAMSTVEVYNRYEEDKTLRWSQFYWNKMLGGVQIAQNTMTTGANMVVGAASGVNSALAGANSLLSSATQNLQSRLSALSGQASVLGGLGNIGGTLLGNALGSAAAVSPLGSPGSNNSGGSSSTGINPLGGPLGLAMTGAR